LAEALALVSNPEVRDQMEKAMNELGQMRAVAAGKEPAAGPDGLTYHVPYSAQRPYRCTAADGSR